MIFTQSATADANDVHDIVPCSWTVLWILSEWSVPRIQQYREQSKKQLMNGRLDRDKFTVSSFPSWRIDWKKEVSAAGLKTYCREWRICYQLAGSSS